MPKNKMNALINGRQYTLSFDESTEYVNKLVEHINEQVLRVKKSGTNLLGERPMVIAALNICDEYFSTIEGGKILMSQAEKNSEKTKEIIEENKRLRQMLENSEYEIDLNVIQKKLDEANKKIESLERQLSNKKRK